MRNTFRQLLLTSLTLAGVSAGAYAHGGSEQAANPSVVPDRMEPVTPKFQRDTEAAKITEHRGGTVPLSAVFTDTSGKTVHLGDYFNHGRPVILQLGYFNCPMLCDVVSKALMDGVKDLPMVPGKDYDILYVSVNPNERWQLAQSKKRNYVEEFGKPGAVDGWNFLVGDDVSIKPLANAVGFGYQKIEGRDEYSHPPMIAVLTPSGKISSYLYGFQFPSAVLAKNIKDARDEKIGSYVEQIVVALCYHYDEYAGKYSLSAMRVMQTAAVFTMLCVGGWLGTRWVRDARAAHKETSTHA